MNFSHFVCLCGYIAWAYRRWYAGILPKYDDGETRAETETGILDRTTSILLTYHQRTSSFGSDILPKKDYGVPHVVRSNNAACLWVFLFRLSLFQTCRVDFLTIGTLGVCFTESRTKWKMRVFSSLPMNILILLVFSLSFTLCVWFIIVIAHWFVCYCCLCFDYYLL